MPDATWSIYECTNCLDHVRVSTTATQPPPMVCRLCGGSNWRVLPTWKPLE